MLRTPSDKRAALIFRVIALYELFGAGWSAAALFRAVLRLPGIVIPWSFVVLFLGGFGLVALAGLQLLKRTELGELLSIVAQALQVLHVTVGPVAFRFTAGLEATVFYLGNRFTYFVGLSAALNLWRGSQDVPFAIGINLIPVAVFAVFLWLPSPKTLKA